MTMKKKVTSRKTSKTTDEKLSIFLQALREKYPNDPTTPGITLSKLARNDLFYCSINRFTARYGEGKYIVLARQAISLSTVIDLTLEAWLEHIDPKQMVLETLLRNRGF